MAVEVATLTSTKAIVTYSDLGSTNDGKANILTISGSSVTVGAVATFETGTCYYPDVAALNSTQAIVAFQEAVATSIEAIVLNVDGTTITPATGVTISTDAGFNVEITSDVDGRAIVIYGDFGNSNRITLKELTITGSTISVGADQIFTGNPTNSVNGMGLDAIDGVAVASYTNSSDTYGTATLLGGIDVLLDTWYYPHLIRKDSDESIDIIFSTSKTNPTLPSGYSYSRRIRGAVLTDGSANILGFTQKDDIFRFNTRIYDLITTTLGTTR